MHLYRVALPAKEVWGDSAAGAPCLSLVCLHVYDLVASVWARGFHPEVCGQNSEPRELGLGGKIASLFSLTSNNSLPLPSTSNVGDKPQWYQRHFCDPVNRRKLHCFHFALN